MPRVARKQIGKKTGKQTWLLIYAFVAPLTLICYQLASFKTSSFLNYGYDNNHPINLEAYYTWSNFWAEQSDSCFRVDNICRRNYGWFYDSDRSTKDQPSIIYTQNIRYGARDPDQRIYFNVSSHHGNNNCSYSSKAYHVVVQTHYMNMMGEFYHRFILGMNQLIRKYPAQYEKDVQLYLHFFEKGKSHITHGHHLFLNGLTQNYKVDTFLSLVEDDSCQCFEKLAFCGYTRHVNITTDKIPPTLSGSAFIPLPYIPQSGGTSSLAILRKDIMGEYLNKDPMIKQKIHNRRRQIILSRMFLQNGVGEEKIINVDEWKIIGLTDRKYRRVWLNIDDSIKACSKFYSHKVICMKLNVEDANSSEEQLLMHASLNSIIGVHGSQFTNGVLLPRGSVILELLPWIKYLNGINWVAKTSAPTPMGQVFHNSDINHLGYCLGRESVPLCEHVDKADEELEKACLTVNKTNYNQYDWDVRDFNVDVDIVTKFISAFILQNNTICDKIQKRGKEKNFILYNVFCSHTANATESEYSAEHYYQPKCEF